MTARCPQTTAAAKQGYQGRDVSLIGEGGQTGKRAGPMERKEGGKVGTEGGGCVKGVVEGVRQEGGLGWLAGWLA